MLKELRKLEHHRFWYYMNVRRSLMVLAGSIPFIIFAKPVAMTVVGGVYGLCVGNAIFHYHYQAKLKKRLKEELKNGNLQPCLRGCIIPEAPASSGAEVRPLRRTKPRTQQPL